MAKIGLTDTGWSLVPEGYHVFKIIAVEYNEEFGKIKVEMATKDGQKHIERYTLVSKDGELNEGANKAFSYLAKTALNNFSLDEIDTNDLVGCYIVAEVMHVESDTINEKTGKPYVNVNLGDKRSASGFDAGVYEGVELGGGVDDDVDDDVDVDDFLGD